MLVTWLKVHTICYISNGQKFLELFLHEWMLLFFLMYPTWYPIPHFSLWLRRGFLIVFTRCIFSHRCYLVLHKIQKFILFKIWFDNYKFWRHWCAWCQVVATIINGDISFVLAFVKIGVPNAYGCSMDVMDIMCDRHPWCATKTRNIHNNFGFSYRQYACTCDLQCPKDYYDYMYCNGGLQLQRKDWVNSYPIFCGKYGP